MQVLIKQGHLILEHAHEHYKETGFDKISQAHRFLPHLDIELVRHDHFVTVESVESFVKLVIIIEINVIIESKVVAGGLLKD